MANNAVTLIKFLRLEKLPLGCIENKTLNSKRKFSGYDSLIAESFLFLIGLLLWNVLKLLFHLLHCYITLSIMNRQNHKIFLKFKTKSLCSCRSENKTLISITAKYNETICMNVIQGVLFGTAPSTEPFLLLSDVRGGAGYVTAPLESSFVFLFGPTELEVREMLTFDWFKENYICKDHPEHCK